MPGETVAVCVKVGGLYGPEYVNRLAAMVARNAKRPYQFVCLTDDPRGVDVRYTDVATDLPGWWSKLVLFRPHPALEGRRVVYLDLDTVISGNIDFLFDYGGDFAMLRSFLPPSAYGSAIMSIGPEFGRAIWSEFHRSPRGIMNRLHGDQDWIAERMVVQPDVWQDVAPGKIGSYKVDRLEDGPRDFAVCCFHGTPKPHEVNGWVALHWRT
jgi:hypothetical protein